MANVIAESSWKVLLYACQVHLEAQSSARRTQSTALGSDMVLCARYSRDLREDFRGKLSTVRVRPEIGRIHCDPWQTPHWR